MAFLFSLDKINCVLCSIFSLHKLFWFFDALCIKLYFGLRKFKDTWSQNVYFFFHYQFGNPKIYLGKAEFADIFSGMFFSHIWNKFSGKSQDALMSVYHIRERLVCSEKKGNISISQKFAGDKKSHPSYH